MATSTLHRSALGAVVREHRRHRGMTVRDLARAVGVSAGTVSAIENGKTGVSTERAIQLADVLGVRVERLVDDQTEPVVDARWSVRAVATEEGRGHHAGPWRTYEPLVMDPALRGALASFLEFGYHGSTMRGIAERAGLSVAGLYHYYASKQQMLVTILDGTMAELAWRTEAALADGVDPAQRFANLVECQALHHTYRREVAFIGASEMRSLASGARHRIAAIRSEEQHKLDREVIDGCRAGIFGTSEPQAAARAIVTMCTALVQWYRPNGPTTPEDVASQYVRFALDLVQCRHSVRR